MVKFTFGTVVGAALLAAVALPVKEESKSVLVKPVPEVCIDCDCCPHCDCDEGGFPPPCIYDGVMLVHEQVTTRRFVPRPYHPYGVKGETDAKQPEPAK